LRAVLDAVGSAHAAIYAFADTGPLGLLFAAAHPDRTRALVLNTTSARFLAASDYPVGIAEDALAGVRA